MYSQFNFFKYTFAVFTKVNQPLNFIKPHYTSKHGSRYFFTAEGVYRYSNHWGRVGNCRWRLEGIDFKQQTAYWGFCRWDMFYNNNDDDKLFFIEQVGQKQFSYNHFKNTDQKEVLVRSASETAKILKKINEVITDSSWAKYLKYDDFEDIQKYFVQQLITTKKAFSQIKREYMHSKDEKE